MPLNFRVGLSETKRDVLVLHLEGDLDLDAAEAFDALLSDLIEQGRNRLVADCTGLHYMSSRGAGEIFHALKSARDAGGDLKVAGLGGKARTVFDMLGLETIIDLLPTSAEATKSFAKLDEPRSPEKPDGMTSPFLTSAEDASYHKEGCAKTPEAEAAIYLTSEDVASLLGKKPCRRCIG